MNNEELEYYKYLKEQEIKEKDEEIERLNNIIKEVREYLENKQQLNFMFGNIVLSKESQDELFKILNKVNEMSDKD